MPSLAQEKRLAILLEKANRLPRTPGVYLMKNARGDVIYVGKSRALKNRVSQYFQRISDPVSYTHLTLPTILLV